MLWLYGDYGATVGSVKTPTGYNGTEGDVLRTTVDLVEGTMTWERLRPNPLQIARVVLLEAMRQMDLYPYLDFHSSFDGEVTIL